MFNFFSKREVWLPVLALIIIGSFIYSFNLNNELFWDDDDWIINNVYVHSLSLDNIKFWFSNNVLAGVGLQSNYYRPFLFFTFALNWVISETKPFLWHFVSNSIHIANAVLVFVLLRKVLTTSDVRGTSDVKIWFFGWSWFFIGLAMVSGITPINALIYEHWLYLPMIGFWLVISFYLVKLFDFLKSKNLIIRSLLLTSLLAYLLFFAYQSIQRNILWRDPVEFYKNILKYEPDSVRINNNLGNQYFNQGDKEQAEFYYRKATASGDEFA